MKLALVHKSYGSVGGTEGFLAGLVEGLEARGHELDLYVASAPGMGTSPNRSSGLRLRRLQGRGGGWLATLVLMLSAAARLRGRNYDQVLHLGRTGPGGIYRAGGGCHRAWRQLLLERARGRLARLALHLSPAHRLRLWHERRALHSPSTVVVVPSERARRDLIAHYGEVGHGVQVLPNGVDLERFSPAARHEQREEQRAHYGLAPSETCLLFFGSDPWRKGLDRVLHAFALLRASEPGPLRLLVLGCARQEPWVRRLVRRLDLGGSVILGGREDQPLRAYAAADLLVLPTRYDPFANVTLEALACGLPVVTTSCNGAVEAAPSCPALFVVPGESPGAALAEAVQAALAQRSDPGLERSARRAAEDWGRERSVECWEAFLSRAGSLGGGSGG